MLDLGGNVRKNPKLSGTTHNVFGIQIGVSINLLVRREERSPRAQILYASADEFWRREQKYEYLNSADDLRGIDWKAVEPDDRHSWLLAGLDRDFDSFVPMGTKSAKRADGVSGVVFRDFSYGVVTARDVWAYSYSEDALQNHAQKLVDSYNSEAYAWRTKGRPDNVAEFVLAREPKIKWTRRLFKSVKENIELAFDLAGIRQAIYRPFCKQFLYFHKVLNEEIYSLPRFWPSGADSENKAIWLKVGSEWQMFALAIDVTPDALPQGGTQCFPFYTYAEDGTNRRENITDWALDQFRSRYADPSITKRDIFHYVYAILHHPEYRQRYAANLRRELPRIPFVEGNGPSQSAESSPVGAAHNSPGRKPGVDRKKENNSTLPKAVAGGQSPQATGATTDADIFRAFVKAGQRLAEIHVHYEQQPEYPLKKIEKKGEQLDYQVEKMKLNKDKTQLIYNKFLTLDGIPPETYEYRLGNRSALEWIIDQYQVSTDKRSGITNDPNRQDDPTYVLRLIGQVITVSLETVKIVNAFPELGITQIAGR